MHYQNLREVILEEMIKIVPFDGWNNKSLEQACLNLNLDKNYGLIVFPAGIKEILKYAHDKIDNNMLEKLSKFDLTKLKIRDKITLAIKIRLDELTQNKQLVRKTIAWYMLSSNNIEGLKVLYKTINKIWYVTGDKSTDFNFYTKRFSLAMIYLNTIIYWLGDNSVNNQISLDFFIKQIDLLMKYNPRKILSKIFDLNNIPFLRLIKKN